MNDGSAIPKETKKVKPVQASQWVLGFGGALIGAAIGFGIQYLLIRINLTGAAIPGALLGLGFGMASGFRSQFAGIVCALLGLAAGIYTEWHFFPFVADESFIYFVKNVFDLPFGTKLMIAIGGAFAFWFGQGRN